jgi:CelD/BcsL family acetyltransferase involved in cellulose biosynthesis
VQIDVLRPNELSSALAGQWRALQRDGRRWDSPFLSPCWVKSVAQAKASDSLRVAVISEGGEPRAFMAAQVGAITAIAAGGAMSDYEGLVGDPGPNFDPAALVRALGVSRYDFSHVPADQSTFAAHSRGEALSWMIDLPDGYEAYAAQRRAAGVSALKEIDRKRRKVEREVGQTEFTACAASQADFDQLIAWKRAQYQLTGQTDVLAAPWTMQLLRDLYALDTPGFGGRLFTLHIGARLAAAHFHLVGETTIHAWMISHEPELERYSPGLLLFQDILRWMEDQPYDRLDLGYGDYRFKTELSNVQRPLVHGFVGPPSAATMMREVAYAMRRAAEALPLGPVSELPGKAMRRLDLKRGLR